MYNHLNYTEQQYYLPLRGKSLNPIIDATTPLLGMILRLKNINSEIMPDKLYSQVVTDIQSIEQLLKEQGYEIGIVVSFRYILCTFIDEIALAHGWGSNNNWFNKSLLTHFHNETWGGEKVYILLEKLMADVKRYKELLEFIFICFSLGFRGRYKVNNHNSEFELIYNRLYNLLATQYDNKNTEIILYSSSKDLKSNYFLGKRITIKKVFFGGFLGLIGIYSIYFFLLKHQSSLILEQLNNLLN